MDTKNILNENPVEKEHGEVKIPSFQLNHLYKLVFIKQLTNALGKEYILVYFPNPKSQNEMNEWGLDYCKRNMYRFICVEPAAMIVE